MNIISEMTILRETNLSILKEELNSYYKVINELFEIEHEICKLFNNKDNFLRIIGISFTKGIILSKSIFSLIVDGHAQESGTLLRPLIEIIELHRYLSIDENKIQEVINNKLPSAGERAKTIKGKFKNLRDYLNNNSSHFNFTYDSCNHLINFKNFNYKPTQVVSKNVLENNLKVFAIFQFFLCYETLDSILKKTNISNELLMRMNNIQKFIINDEES